MRKHTIAITLTCVFIVLGGMTYLGWRAYQQYMNQEPQNIVWPTRSEEYGAGPKVFFQDEKVVALCYAIEKSDYQTVRQLLNEGVDINVRGKYGMTPLLWAFPLAQISTWAEPKVSCRFQEEHEKRIEMLLELGADPNLQLEEDLPKEIYPLWPYQKGVSVTYLSAYISSTFVDNDKPLIPLVLKHGGDPNIVFTAQNRTPIYNIVDPLRGYPQFDRPGWRVPQFAKGYPKTLAALIDAGADIEFKNNDNSTPILKAASHNYYGMVYMLLEAGADYQYTPPNVEGLAEEMLRIKKFYKKRSERDFSVFDKPTSSISLCRFIDPYFPKVIAWLKDRGYPLDPELNHIEEFLDKLVKETPLEYKDYDPFLEQWAKKRKAATEP